jgi:hypothetical protein
VVAEQIAQAEVVRVDFKRQRHLLSTRVRKQFKLGRAEEEAHQVLQMAAMEQAQHLGLLLLSVEEAEAVVELRRRTQAGVAEVEVLLVLVVVEHKDLGEAMAIITRVVFLQEGVVEDLEGAAQLLQHLFLEAVALD